MFVNDLRPEGEPSLEHYPRMTSYADVQRVFGAEVLEHFGWAVTPPGALCWRIVGWNVRTGAAIFFPRVLGEDGTPYYNAGTNTTAYVFHTWAGAPDFELSGPLRPDYNSILAAVSGQGFTIHHALGNWSKRDNGDADFAYGGGMIGGPSGGPGAIWVAAAPAQIPDTQQAQYSDCAARLGWIGGTDHLTASPIFRLTRKEGSQPPEPPTGQELLVNVDAAGNVMGWIAFTPGAPPSNIGAASLGLWRDGAIVAHVPWAGGQPVSSGVFAKVGRWLRKL